jgi:GNAT superfamily N-acetyltransferase
MSIEASFRRATRDDVPDIVRLLADDVYGAARERPESAESYRRAFEAVDADPNNELIVAVVDRRIAGVLQITFIPGLTRQGSWRALIEAVRVDSRLRSRGLGGALMQHAIGRARERGCRMLQLTTDKRRGDAKRFYERLGFVASHEGMKLQL